MEHEAFTLLPSEIHDFARALLAIEPNLSVSQIIAIAQAACEVGQPLIDKLCPIIEGLAKG